MWRYWLLLTDVKASEIGAMQRAVADGSLHPMQAKKDLARTIAAGFHGMADAERAGESWAVQFQSKGVNEDVPEVRVEGAAEGLMNDGQVRLAKLLVLAGLASSAAEATRKLSEHAVSVNGEKTTAKLLERAAVGEAPVLRLGRRSVRVVWA